MAGSLYWDEGLGDNLRMIRANMSRLTPKVMILAILVWQQDKNNKYCAKGTNHFRFQA